MSLHRGFLLPLLDLGAAMPKAVAARITDALAVAPAALGRGPLAARRLRWFCRFCTDFARLRQGVAALDGYVARTDGLHRLDEARDAGKGLLILSAHLGNWELGAAWAARRGLAVTVVSERAPDPSLDRWREETRERCGVRTAYLGDPSLAPRLLESLRAGGCVAMLVDREPSPGAGAARFAEAAGARLLTAFVPFLADGRYSIEVGATLPADASLIRAAVSRAIAAHSDQWYTPRPAWKAQGPARMAATKPGFFGGSGHVS